MLRSKARRPPSNLRLRWSRSQPISSSVRSSYAVVTLCIPSIGRHIQSKILSWTPLLPACIVDIDVKTSKTVFAVSFMGLAFVGCQKTEQGCHTDIECKGDRICVDGKCADATQRSALAPTSTTTRATLSTSVEAPERSAPTSAGGSTIPPASKAKQICGTPKSILVNLGKKSAGPDASELFGGTEMVEVGDLNGDGRPEYAGAFVSKVYSESWILTSADRGCFVDLTDGGLGGTVSKPLSSVTNGWHDLEIGTVLNGMGGLLMSCFVTFTATFDGKKYKLSRIKSVSVNENADITPPQCRKQAEEFLSGK